MWRCGGGRVEELPAANGRFRPCGMRCDPTNRPPLSPASSPLLASRSCFCLCFFSSCLHMVTISAFLPVECRQASGLARGVVRRPGAHQLRFPGRTRAAHLLATSQPAMSLMVLDITSPPTGEPRRSLPSKVRGE